jgi:4-amino-4-deoxy-L-arabinose transferase-like glycosyltransferase
MKLRQVIKGLTYLAAAAFIMAFILTAVMRINYPFELEWMEGGQLDHIVKILDGQEIYVEPSLEFIPYIYTPLYSYISAGFAEITGVSFFPLRLVSYFSVLLTFIVLFKIVKDKTGSRYWAFISAGLYAAMFKTGGFWFDIARVDSLFILLFIVSIYYLLKKDKLYYAVIAGIFAALSFLTKQSVVFMLFPIVIWLFIYRRKAALYYFSTLMVISVGVSLYFNVKTDGWYWFWNFGLPATHHWNLKYLYAFWIDDLFLPLNIAVLSAIAVFFKINKNESQNKTDTAFYLYFLIGCLLDAWLLRLHYGGYLNALFPALLAIAILAPVGLAKIEKATEGKNGTTTLVYLVLLLQFSVLIYNPANAIPTKQDEAGGRKFIETLKNINGEVFVPCHSYIPRLAGKKSYAHAVVIHDLFISKSHWKEKVKRGLDSALSHHRFAAVIMNPEWHLPGLDKYYYKADKIFPDNDNSFYTVIGKTRPDDIWLPKQ